MYEHEGLFCKTAKLLDIRQIRITGKKHLRAETKWPNSVQERALDLVLTRPHGPARWGGWTRAGRCGPGDRDEADWSLTTRSQRGRGCLASLDAEEADRGGETRGGFRRCRARQRMELLLRRRGTTGTRREAPIRVLDGMEELRQPWRWSPADEGRGSEQ